MKGEVLISIRIAASLAQVVAMTLCTGCATMERVPDPVEDQLGWVCQRTPSEFGGRFWVNKELTSDGRHKSYSAYWRVSASNIPNSGGADMFWTMPAADRWYAGLDHATFNFVFARQPTGPIKAYLYLDGELAHSQVIVDRRVGRNMRSAPMWGGSFFLTPASLSADRLHQAGTASVIVTGPGGARIAQVELPMPDWRALDQAVAEVLPALDGDGRDREAKCMKQTGPEI